MDQEWDIYSELVFQDALLNSIDNEQLLLSAAIEHSLEQLQLDPNGEIAESFADEWREEIKRNFDKAVKRPRKLTRL